MLRKLFVVLAVLLSVQSASAPALAQTRSVFWQRWDVLINDIDTTANRFTVTEKYEVHFTGRFSFGSVVIPLTNLDEIRDLRVLQNGQPLQANCSERAGTFCATRQGSDLSIVYYFFQPVSDQTENFQIIYTVLGALRVYEGGDQLWWDAIPSEHFGFSIGSARVTVQLPNGYAPREGIDPVVTYGAPGNVQVNGTTVTADATRQIGGNEYFSIRVQYPHDPNARVPAWQARFDEQRAYDENVKPVIDLLAIVGGLVIGIGGPLLFFTLWRTRGRDPEIGPVPEYLSEPPSDLPPAIVGTLVDEKADLRDIIATLLDLSKRGYMVIEESRIEGFFGIGTSTEFTYKRTDKAPDDLRKYEKRLFNRIFSSNKMERSLSSLKNNFYTAIPQLQSDLYQEMVDEGFFTRKPDTTRNLWVALGVVLMVIAGGAFFILMMLAEEVSFSLLCLPAALGLTAIVAMAVAPAMPAKTRKGAEEAAKWNAFLEYLRNLERYTDVKESADQFERYLPYAVAFGLDRTWFGKFKGIDNVPVPTWYFPTYLGPYRRGYVPGTPLSGYGTGGMGGTGGLPGELARAGDGGFSLDSMSGGMAQGLESMSAGLTNMMNSASRALTSRPQSASSGSSGSWRSGGGGWSGGGFSGGGGSGGGSRGFG